MNLIPA
jgi:hypothetical protein